MSATAYFKKIQNALENLIKISSSYNHTQLAKIFSSLRNNSTPGLEASPSVKQKSTPNAPKKPHTAAFLFDSSEYICLVCRNRYTKVDSWKYHIK